MSCGENCNCKKDVVIAESPKDTNIDWGANELRAGEWSEIIAEEVELTSSMDSLSLSMGAGAVTTDNSTKEGVNP